MNFQPKDDVLSEDKAVVSAGKRRTKELFHYLVMTFQSMLPPEKAEQFGRIAEELEASVVDNCANCPNAMQRLSARDPRRNRFLLRLVVSRVSPLFSGDRPSLPRSLIEGLDRYLKKAFGPIMYDELNAEANQILDHLAVDDDQEMWEHIRRDPQIKRFVDTVFIRILFRFENFAQGKKTFMSILDKTMQEISRYQFGEAQFSAVFEALFAELWGETKVDEQRLRWDFLFGDGTSQRIATILTQGLARWLRRQEGGQILQSGTSAAKRREAATAAAEQGPYSIKDRN
jgi:hypothetical protein